MNHATPPDFGYDTALEWARVWVGPTLPEDDSREATPVVWPRLSDAGAVEESTRLEAWVNWLIARYGLDHRTIPACWPQHGAHVEELSALRTGWAAAHRRTSDGDAPLRWHHDFALARDRLTDWTARAGCRRTEHRVDNR